MSLTQIGSSGNNTLKGGVGSDVLRGLGGDDVLAGGAGGDLIDGGAGTDTADYTSDVSGVRVSLATRRGDSGDAQGDRLVSIENLTGGSGDDVLIGDAGANRLDGDLANDTLVGGAGADTLIGGSGVDVADYRGASAGVSVTLPGWNGVFSSNPPQDAAAGAASGADGTDVLIGIEVVEGSDHGDTLTGGAPQTTQTLRGNKGDDLFVAQFNSSEGLLVDGGCGNDTLDASRLAFANLPTDPNPALHDREGITVTEFGVVGLGDAGNVTMMGVEAVIGTANRDTMRGFDGADETLVGGAGNDIITGSLGADSLAGGDGLDTLDYSHATGAIYVNLGTNDALGGEVACASPERDLEDLFAQTKPFAEGIADGDSISGFENVIGGSGGDILVGSDGANILDGRAGDDVLEGGAGADTLIGGAGFDHVDYSTAGSGITVSGAGVVTGDTAGTGDQLVGVEAVIGTAFDDDITASTPGSLVRGEAGDDTLAGGAGNDTVDGGDGDDHVKVLLNGTSNEFDGGAGADTVSFEGFAKGVSVWVASGYNDSISSGSLAGFEYHLGSSFNDSMTGSANVAVTIDGAAGDDVIQAGARGDTLFGGNGEDSLSGGLAADSMDGGADDDTLAGGAGADVLAGGAGNDVYVVDETGDTFVEGSDAAVDGSDDRVESSVDFSLEKDAADAAIENLNLTGTAVRGAGNELDNRIVGNATENSLDGAAGDDYIVGEAGADSIKGGSGDDTLLGGIDGQTDIDSSADTLVGGAGNDSLVGGDGVDVAGYDATVLGSAITFDGTDWVVKAGAAEGEDSLSGVEAVDGAGAGRIWLVGGSSGIASLADLFDGNAANGEAVDGDVIRLASGLNETGNVTVNKSVTILGANAGTAGTGVRGSESVLARLTITATDVVVDGVKIAEGLAVPLNEFAGIYVSASGAVIRNSILSRSGQVDGDASRGIITAAGTAGTLTVEANLISGWATGVYVNPPVAATVKDNSFTGNFVQLSADDPSGLNVTANSFVAADGTLEQIGIATKVFGAAYVGSGIYDLSTQIGAGNTFSGEAGVTLPAPVNVYPLGDSTVTGTSYDDMFNAQGGNASLDGAGGNDTIGGGDGADSLGGGIGADSLDGGAANDLANGGDGADSVAGGAGDDTLIGGGMATTDGADTLAGGQGDDNLTGGAGNDSLVGDDGVDGALYTSGVVPEDITWNGTVWVVESEGEATDTLAGVEFIDANGAGGQRIWLVSSLVEFDTALAGAATNDIIRFAAGVYEGNRVITKSVIIQGEKFGQHGQRADLDGYDPLSGETVLNGDWIIAGGRSVSIDGVVFLNDASNTSGISPANSPDGTGPLLRVVGGTDHAVTNSVFWSLVQGGERDWAFYGQAGTTGLSVTDNFFGGTQVGKYGTANFHRSIWVENDTRISGNVFDNVRNAINQENGGVGSFITDNQIRSAGSGVAFGPVGPNPTSYAITSGLLNGNTFTDVDIDLNVRNFGSTGVSLDLNATGTASSAPTTDPLTVFGGPGADTLGGSNGADALFGNARTSQNTTDTDGDSLSGADGNDSLFGFGGNDTLNGGKDNDLLLGESDSALQGFAGHYTGNVGNDVMDGGEGADTLRGQVGADSLQGGSGDDILLGDDGADTLGGADTLLGDGGADSVVGGRGADSLDGGTESDTIDGGLGNDRADGGSGADTVRGDVGDDTLLGSAGVDLLQGGEGDDILDGGDDGDVLVGGTGRDTLAGGDGADSLVASGGPGDTLGDSLSGGVGGDTLVGSALGDALSGGADADNLSGGDGADNASGDEGNDTILGGLGDDTMSGGSGGDRIEGDEGADSLLGDDGTDTLLGGLGSDTLSGGDAADSLVGGIGADTMADSLSGGAGSDTLDGHLGADTLLGGDGADLLRGGQGNDVLLGDDGAAEADTLIGGAGADSLNGGAGSADWADYSGSSAAISVNLQDAVNTLGDAEGDSLTGVENVLGSAFDDFIRSDLNANYLVGGAGKDSLQGQQGADTLEGGAGADALVGDADIDVATYRNASSAVVVDLTFAIAAQGEAAGDSFLGIENLEGSRFNDVLAGDGTANLVMGALGSDTLYGYGENDTLSGGDGDEWMIGGVGADRFEGGAGFDLVAYWSAAAAVKVDMVTGGSGGEALGDTFLDVERVFGSAHADRLLGNALGNWLNGFGANDTIEGRAGDDSLFGDAGDDWLVGGTGADRLVGGDGFDLAAYWSATSSVVADLANGGTLGEANGDTYAAVERLFGSGHADTLRGDGSANRLDGNTGSDLLEGRGGADFLAGDAGADTLNGGAGVDRLLGGDGADVFRFSTIADGGDTVLDFASGVDKIQIVSAGFGNVLALGALAPSQLSFGTASSAQAQFVYVQTSGVLTWDADGTGAGAAVTIATFDNKSVLTASDFAVIA